MTSPRIRSCGACWAAYSATVSSRRRAVTGIGNTRRWRRSFDTARSFDTCRPWLRVRSRRSKHGARHRQAQPTPSILTWCAPRIMSSPTRCWQATVPSSAKRWNRGLPTMWRVFPGRWPMRRSTCLSGCRARAAAACTFGSRVSGPVTGLIHARRASPDDRDDLFTRLLGAVHPETSQTMSDEHLVDNLLTFLLAGNHTIAAALTWTLYLTSRAPEWEARMLAEIRQVVPSGPITGEHIDKLVTVQQVLKESLRLFPPLPLMSRYAAEDVELAGEHIKAGTLIGLPIYVIHRHRKLWDSPDRFDPSRFAPGRD